MRACRTDKGVHAAMQIVSLKIILKDPIPEIMNSLNSLLPSDIRICGIHPVGQSFDSKLHCDSRFYEYLIPTFMFKHGSSFDSSFLKNMNLERNMDTNNANQFDKNESDTNSESEEISERPLREDVNNASKVNQFDPLNLNNFHLSEESALELSSFRLSSEELQKIRSVLNSFEGSHFFHNYTIKKSSSDPSACRKIISFKVKTFF